MMPMPEGELARNDHEATSQGVSACWTMAVCSVTHLLWQSGQHPEAT
jgi:hypothetical protein